MHYLIVSFTHKNTQINLREKLAFNNDLEKNIFLKNTISCSFINGIILTSTCNRIETISSVSDFKMATRSIMKALSDKSLIDIDLLYDIVSIYEDENAIRHLFTVVSSLDSLVIGETQIAGQFKNSLKFSVDNETVDQRLLRLCEYSFKCAKEVRNDTSLGSGSVSIASTAVAKAKEIFKEKENVTALVIGAGEMSELTVKHLLKEKFKIVLMSRNIKKAELLAQNIIENNDSYTNDMIEVKSYENIKNALNSVELLITATSAPYPIITNELVESVSFSRYWFDIAIPRDIDENIKKDNLHIYVVDDLKEIVDRNMESREVQAKKAYLIISDMTKQFYVWLNSLDTKPLLKNIYSNANEIIEEKISNAISKGFISKDDEKNVSKLCQTIMSKFLHPTSLVLKDSSGEENNNDFTDVVKSLCSKEK